MIRSIASATALTLMTSSFAFAGDLDVWISFDDPANPSKIEIGTADKGTTPVTFTPDVLVHEAEFGELFPANVADEPGFFTEQLPPGTIAGFNLTNQLREWNVTNQTADFSSNTITIFEELDLSGASATTPSSPGGFTAGFNFIEADATGFFDDHPTFVLDMPADGIYILALEATTTTPGVANSDEFFIVLGYNEGGTFGTDEQFEEEIEAAVEYATNVLVPAPGAAAVLGLAGIAAIRRKR
ncbi:MAG: hypothetical protein AAGD00_04285 [Planctomycetota bacterium]